MPLKKHFRFLVFAGTVCFVAVVAGFLYFSNESTYSETKELSDVSSEKEYTFYFSSLAGEKGSLYAFEVLRRVKLLPGVNVHSVAHAIGYVLFEEQGISGIHECTDEFRSACAHAIVIQALSEGGQSAVADIVQACADAPGGRGAYAICFHGIGHGLVASSGYDFKSVVSQCAKMSGALSGPASSGHRFMSAAEECIGGSVMEMVQGAHNKDEWERAVALYLPIDNPFRPCIDEYVPASLRSACLMSLTQRFFGSAGISEDVPLPETYSEAMAVCASASREEDRVACYGGFGKEFVFYGTQFDSGDVNTLSDSALVNIRDWCGYAKDSAGGARCISVALDTLFWAGQNDPRSALRFCALAPNASRMECYTGLVEDIRYFLGGDKKLQQACGMLPMEFQTTCKAVSSSVSNVLYPSVGLSVTRI